MNTKGGKLITTQFRNRHEEDGADVDVYVICPAANSGNGGGDGPIRR